MPQKQRIRLDRHIAPEVHELTCRRAFLRRSACGIGVAALASLLRRDGRGADSASALRTSRGVIRPLHVAPKARRIIFLTMAGGPSHLETLDYKPKLAEMHGQPMPESYTKGQQIAQLQGAKLNCFGPQYEFEKFGQSGQHISRILPHIGS